MTIHPHNGGHNNHGEQPAHAEIAELAYAFYVGGGYRDGNDLDDWLRAEHELKKRRHGRQPNHEA